MNKKADWREGFDQEFRCPDCEEKYTYKDKDEGWREQLEFLRGATELPIHELLFRHTKLLIETLSDTKEDV